MLNWILINFKRLICILKNNFFILLEVYLIFFAFAI
jgi:hypothetical protein